MSFKGWENSAGANAHAQQRASAMMVHIDEHLCRCRTAGRHLHHSYSVPRQHTSKAVTTGMTAINGNGSEQLLWLLPPPLGTSAYRRWH